eukprot:jgi/Bigna1/84134/fgenesh1_pg.124_\
MDGWGWNGIEAVSPVFWGHNLLRRCRLEQHLTHDERDQAGNTANGEILRIKNGRKTKYKENTNDKSRIEEENNPWGSLTKWFLPKRKEGLLPPCVQVYCVKGGLSSPLKGTLMNFKRLTRFLANEKDESSQQQQEAKGANARGRHETENKEEGNLLGDKLERVVQGGSDVDAVRVEQYYLSKYPDQAMKLGEFSDTRSEDDYFDTTTKVGGASNGGGANNNEDYEEEGA